MAKFARTKQFTGMYAKEYQIFCLELYEEELSKLIDRNDPVEARKAYDRVKSKVNRIMRITKADLKKHREERIKAHKERIEADWREELKDVPNPTKEEIVEAKYRCAIRRSRNTDRAKARDKAYRKEYNQRPDVKKKLSKYSKKSANSPAAYDSYNEKLSPYMETRRNPRSKSQIQVRCMYCNKWTTPTRQECISKLKALSTTGQGESNFYCNTECKEACPTYNQTSYPKGFRKGSSREALPVVRKMAFERDKYTCVKCGAKGKNVTLHAHHIEGVAHNPMGQGDVSNLITVCKSCHKEIHKTAGCTYHDYKCKTNLIKK